MYSLESQLNAAVEFSRLDYLHLRGYCVPLRRFVLDLKHLSAPFRHRSGLAAFLDHGSRLRKVSFATKSPTFLEVSDKERLLLSADLYGAVE